MPEQWYHENQGGINENLKKETHELCIWKHIRLHHYGFKAKLHKCFQIISEKSVGKGSTGRKDKREKA